MAIADIEHIKTLSDVKGYVSDNKRLMTYLSDSVKFSGFMGSGDYGKVWALSGGMLILKATTDSVEMKIAQQLLDKKSKGFLQIYACQTFPKFQIRVQDRCVPLDSNDFVADVTNYAHNIYENGMDYKTYVTDTIRFIKKTPTGALLASKLKKKDFDDSFDLLNRAYNDYKTLNLPDNFDDYDFNSGNIMKTVKNGTYVMVDF